MSVGDFYRLPPAVRIAFVVMLWPVIWAAAAVTMALVTDILRLMRNRGAFQSDETVVLRG